MIPISLCRNNGWTNRDYWIGLELSEQVIACGCDESDCRDNSCEACRSCRQTYTWRSGSDSTYENWADGFPEENNRCVLMQENGKWISGPCNANPTQRYVCENGICNSRLKKQEKCCDKTKRSICFRND